MGGKYNSHISDLTLVHFSQLPENSTGVSLLFQVISWLTPTICLVFLSFAPVCTRVRWRKSNYILFYVHVVVLRTGVTGMAGGGCAEPKMYQIVAFLWLCKRGLNRSKEMPALMWARKESRFWSKYLTYAPVWRRLYITFSKYLKGGQKLNFFCWFGKWKAVFANNASILRSSSAPEKGKMLSESTKLACLWCNLAVLLPSGRNSNTFPVDQICNFSQKISWVFYMHIHKMKITWFAGTLGLEAEGSKGEIFLGVQEKKQGQRKQESGLRTQVKLLQKAGTYRCEQCRCA